MKQLLDRFRSGLRRGPSRSQIDQFLAWARSRAVAFDPLQGAESDITRLSALDGMLRGRRIICLGESDHWVHEKYDFRLLLIRYLYSRGFTWIGEEMGWSDGERLDRYLETGDEQSLNRITMHGYRGDRRLDRDDSPRPGSLLYPHWSEVYPHAELAAEQTRLARAIRASSESRGDSGDRIRFFGFDVDPYAAGGYEDTTWILSPFQREPVVAELLSSLARVPNESIGEEVARLERALAKIESGSERLDLFLPPERKARLVRSVQALCNSLKFAALAYPATEWSALYEAMAIREQVMWQQVDDVVAQLSSSQGVILMSHAFHLAKSCETIRTAGGAGPGGGRVPALGTWLHRRYPGQVFGVWMLSDRGRDLDPWPTHRREFSTTPGTLNSILAQVAPAFLIAWEDGDAGAELLRSETEVALGSAPVAHTAVARQADAIFFVREVTPLKV